MSDTTTRLRSRLASAADYGREKIADTLSPCARDLCWYLVRLSEQNSTDEQLPREVKAAEALWRAAMEIERIEGAG